MTKTISELEAEIAKLQKEIAKQVDSIRTHATLGNELNDIIDRHKQKFTTLETEIKSLKDSGVSNSQKIQELKNQVDSLTASNNQKDQQINQLTNLEELKGQLSDFSHKAGEGKKKLQDLLSVQSTYEKVQLELTDERDKYKKAHDNLMIEIRKKFHKEIYEKYAIIVRKLKVTDLNEVYGQVKYHNIIEEETSFDDWEENITKRIFCSVVDIVSLTKTMGRSFLDIQQKYNAHKNNRSRPPTETEIRNCYQDLNLPRQSLLISLIFSQGQKNHKLYLPILDTAKEKCLVPSANLLTELEKIWKFCYPQKELIAVIEVPQ